MGWQDEKPENLDDRALWIQRSCLEGVRSSSTCNDDSTVNSNLPSADLRYRLQGAWREAESLDPRGNNNKLATHQAWFATHFACNARQTYVPLPWYLFLDLPKQRPATTRLEADQPNDLDLGYPPLRIRQYASEHHLTDRPHTMLWLTKADALPASMFTCRIWGLRYMQEGAEMDNPLQTVHLCLLKCNLGVKRTTPNWSVLRECGH
eukprot:1140016-Pelagomonas_calceolata.AAC.1